MKDAKVINDLHYNGKTVNERLAEDELLDSFEAATQAKDATRMIAILQRVAIGKTWATRLATIILEELSQSPIHLNLNDPRNAGLIRHFECWNELRFPPCMRVVESPRDPYLHLGSHPDIVERVWGELAPVLPQDCRCIVFGTPALVAPRSGIMLAQAFGTQYVLRIPRTSIGEALQGGAKTKVTWAGGQVTDIAQEYGDDWIFGCWLTQEPSWLVAMYNAVENLPAPR